MPVLTVVHKTHDACSATSLPSSPAFLLVPSFDLLQQCGLCFCPSLSYSPHCDSHSLPLLVTLFKLDPALQLIVGYLFILFERQRDRDSKERAPFCWSSPQNAICSQGRTRLKPGNGFPMWVASNQSLQPSLAASQGVLESKAEPRGWRCGVAG